MEIKYKNIIKVFDRNNQNENYLRISDITNINKVYDVVSKIWNIYVSTNKWCESEAYENKEECDSKFKELLEVWDKDINDGK